MALTKMKVKNFIDATESGVTIQTQAPVKAGQTMPIFVPKIMSNIKKGTPSVNTTVTTGGMIFLNAPDCKLNAPNLVSTQNYISPRFENNATWSGIIDDPDKDKVPSGTQVNVIFPSLNILNPSFNVN